MFTLVDRIEARELEAHEMLPLSLLSHVFVISVLECVDVAARDHIFRQTIPMLHHSRCKMGGNTCRHLVRN